MAEASTQQGYEVYTIVSPDGQTRASFIPEKGGVGSSLIMPREREILYLHTNFWDRGSSELPGGWPFLFPICGRLERMQVAGNYLYEHRLYNMPIHGFAAHMVWRVVTSSAADSLTMELTETKNSLAMYPFPFRVQLTYRVSNGLLSCEQVYTNTGDKALPYYAGFHPYFLTPEKNKNQVMLKFQALRTLHYNERLTDIIGEKKPLEVPVAVTKPCINEQLSELDSDAAIELSYPDGLKLELSGKVAKRENLFRYMQIYTISHKPFICVEPWMGVPNALNSVSGVRWIEPGKSEQGYLHVRVA